MILSDQLKRWLSYITVGILLISLAVGSGSTKWGTSIAILMTMLLGIPHGATDHILFRHINKDFGKGFMYRFLVRYLLLMGVFVLTWWILPALALTIFLAISAYHFGQSHWNDLEIEKPFKFLIYSCWGGGLLLSLLMLNYTETLPIVNSMISGTINLPPLFYFFVPALFLFINIGLIAFLHVKHKLNLIASIREVSLLFVFAFLFIQVPLLIGFAIYFVLWHSTLSIRDQILYFQTFRSDYNLKNFILQSLPFTILAFAGIGGLAFLSPFELVSEAWIGQFFILISIVTLPHSILMDTLLEQGVDSELEKEKNTDLDKKNLRGFPSNHKYRALINSKETSTKIS
jgi:Brp/Blh family beta-carotene 15,15'-monooxygenase